MNRNLHRLAEARSLAIHRVIAERIQADRNIVQAARERVDGWLENGSVARAWRHWLELPMADLVARMTSEDEDARSMRQVSPFAGTVDARERWEIWRAARRQFEAVPVRGSG